MNSLLWLRLRIRYGMLLSLFRISLYFSDLGPTTVMYPHGPVAGDSLVPDTSNFALKCLKVDIPEDGMLFFGKRHRKLYVSRQ